MPVGATRIVCGDGTEERGELAGIGTRLFVYASLLGDGIGGRWAGGFAAGSGDRGTASTTAAHMENSETKKNLKTKRQL